MRLGDLDALKDQVQELLDLAVKRVEDTHPNNFFYRIYIEQQNERSRFIKLIDNAPTVKPEKVLVANVTFDEDKLKELVQTEVIDKIKSGELVLKDEIPQGEWVKVKEYRMCIDMSGEIATLYKCSECGRMITILPSRLADYPFCHCGADMRKVVWNEQMGKK